MNRYHWQDAVNALVGIWIFVSPWVLKHTMPSNPVAGELAMWNLWIVGAIIFVVGSFAVIAYRAWEEWVILIAGAWFIVSPWLLGFSASLALLSNAIVFGALIFFFAAWVLTEGPRTRMAR